MNSWLTVSVILGKLNIVSDNPKDVAKGTKIFIIAGPVFAQQPILEKLAPFIEKDSLIGTVFGQGGFDWLASYVLGKRIKKDNLTIWALQHVPSLCKIKTYGQEVRVIGPKLILYDIVFLSSTVFGTTFTSFPLHAVLTNDILGIL